MNVGENIEYTKRSSEKLDPMKNFYKLDKDKSDIEMTNPFKDVQNSTLFVKKLRGMFKVEIGDINSE